MNIPSYVDTFMRFVRIDSVTGEEQHFSDYLFKLYKDVLKIEIVKQDKKGNIYIRFDGAGHPLFFSAHLDTVEPGRGIKPQIKRNYVVSDGETILGADNKIAIASITEAIRRIRSRHIPHRTLELVFTRSEEVNSYGALEFDYRQLLATEGFCFDSVSPIGTVTTASPFYERFDVTLQGKETHASRPQDAINVLPAFASFVEQISMGAYDKDTLINIGVVNAGTVRNTIPGRLTLHGEIRSLREKNLLAAKRTCITTLSRICRQRGIKMHTDFVRENPGYKHTGRSAQKLMNEVSSRMNAVGITPCRRVHWGVSDANIFNDKGLICINLGDGVEHAHSTKERVKISDMEKLVRLMIELVRI